MAVTTQTRRPARKPPRQRAADRRLPCCAPLARAPVSRFTPGLRQLSRVFVRPRAGPKPISRPDVFESSHIDVHDSAPAGITSCFVCIRASSDEVRAHPVITWFRAVRRRSPWSPPALGIAPIRGLGSECQRWGHSTLRVHQIFAQSPRRGGGANIMGPKSAWQSSELDEERPSLAPRPGLAASVSDLALGAALARATPRAI